VWVPKSMGVNVGVNGCDLYQLGVGEEGREMTSGAGADGS
jgi:hypothetical protein